MYVLKRIFQVQRGQEWKAAGLAIKIAAAYEAAGRNPSSVYIGGTGLPGDPGMVYVEWTQEAIEPNHYSNVPKAVFDLVKELRPIQEDTWIEFYELVTAEKLQDRGMS